MNILFATSEAVPLIKTGGLADVSGSLPPAIQALGHDIRVVLPGYPTAIKNAGTLTSIASFTLERDLLEGQILEGTLPGTKVPVYLIDIPHYFNRDGGPYNHEKGGDWTDNPQRFAAFAHTVVQLAMARIDVGWKPDLIHCNDWQTGLIPPLLTVEDNPPASIFTIHNLAYQGLYDKDVFHSLGLPEHFWSPESLEFYHNFSFLKGGLAHAHWITTVSPTYAREIRTPAFSYGLDGLLNHRSRQLSGILNGIDETVWNPSKDVHLKGNYSSDSLQKKAVNKLALQKHFGLKEDKSIPLMASIGRLAEQKGVDLILKVLPKLFESGAQFILLGSGDAWLEHNLQMLASQYPEQFKLTLGYNEPLAHQIEAGADIFLMPSRFEPCGLNQIYSLKYGTIPVVGRTGGLVDTVVDATTRNLYLDTATGFIMDDASPEALLHATERALQTYQQPKVWQKIIKTAMKQPFSWEISAKEYIDIYQQVT
ncbi:MAG: glycogen synthase GlgA [Methylococcales bacterium]|nr:glycogen synthase GlgA [Methylococcales bacterium]MBT7445324.1 glycogen synthase GlgA [Methylococcales bacterium]